MEDGPTFFSGLVADAAMLKVLALCAVLLFGLARTAQAEWQFTPMVGFTMFGNTNLVDLEKGTGERHRHFGGSVAFLGGGILGAEVITIWTPGFFDKSNPEVDLVKSSRSAVVMGNVVLTAPRRWTEYSLRPYVSGGLGLMHASTTESQPGGILPIDVNVAGFNIGGGAIGFLTQRTGVRFDVRYHSTLNRLEEEAPTLGPAHLRYVTASIGIVFRR
jgi:hypothetical protein